MITNKPVKNGPVRTQMILLFLILTAGIATGLAIFTSASTIIALIKTASAGLLLPILLSVILTFLLGPMVTFVQRGGLSRTTSIFIIFLLVASLIFLLVSWLTPHWHQMWDSLRTDLPRYISKLIGFLKEWQANIQDRFPFVQNYDLPGRTRIMAEEVLSEILVQTPRSALRIGSLLLLVPLFSFFFLRDGRRTMRALVAMVPNRYFEMAHDLSFHISNQLTHFIRGRILEALIVGLVVGIGLSFTDIRYAPILGLFAGITNLVPYVGPIVGMVPGIVIAQVDLGMGGQFWWIVTVYVLIAQIIVDNFILIPILISRFSNLHPLWVIIAIVMGGKLYGVLGMIIGVPVASVIKITLLEIRNYRRAFSLPVSVQERENLF